MLNSEDGKVWWPNTDWRKVGIYSQGGYLDMMEFKKGDTVTAILYNNEYPVFFTEMTPLAGDAQRNGEIDILDVITLNKAILGKETLSETQLKAIDFNGNGQPDSEETLKIMKYIVGLITSFTE